MEKDDKAERLAAALRENLRRRKAKVRESADRSLGEAEAQSRPEGTGKEC